MLLATSCAKEEVNTTGETELITVQLNPETKTALGAEGTTTWDADDQVSVTVGEKVVGTLSLVGGSTFSGEITAGLSGEATLNYPAGVTAIPEPQAAVDESFADGAALLEGTTTVEDLRAGKSVELKNKTALLKFTVAQAGNVTFEVGTAKYTVTGCKTGETYYACVEPAEDVNLVARIDGYLSRATSDVVTFTASTVADLEELPAPVASNWGIAGEANDWTETDPIILYKDLNDCVVVRDFSGGAFKFVKDKSWNVNRGIRSRDASSPSKGNWNLCGTKDITLSNGSYDVYFIPKYGVFNFIDKGANVDNYAPSGKAIYLQVKDWSASDAYFEAWAWGSANPDAWYKFAMAGEEDNTHYVMYVPNDVTEMKILRKGPDSTSEAWDSWNDSGNQTIPSGKNMFIEDGWDNYSWGTYTM